MAASVGRALARPRALFVLSVIGAALIWSTSYTATKVALADVPPLTINALRFALAAVLMFAIAAVSGALHRPRPSDIGRMALGGLLGTTLYFSMENVGVDLATASDAALLVASYPAVTMLLEILIYRVRASWIRFLGVGLAIFGVYLIIGQSPPAGETRLMGDLILVATGFVWAFYNFVTRDMGQSYPTITVVFYQTVAGAVACVPLALLEVRSWEVPAASSISMIAYLGVFCSVAAFLLYAHGLKELDASSAVNLLNLVPLFGVATAFVVLREPVGVGQLVGGLVVIVGVVLGLRSPAKREEVSAKTTELNEDLKSPEAASENARDREVKG
ncbi:MAG: DMT family transporter [Rubrobacter sp.]|nr:DMT family transporter [Rubrobacter sp.]